MKGLDKPTQFVVRSLILKQHHFLFKASWRSTAFHFHIEARDPEHAQKRAERLVKRLDGGDLVISVDLIKQLD